LSKGEESSVGHWILPHSLPRRKGVAGGRSFRLYSADEV
jgi:hypothetical protein